MSMWGNRLPAKIAGAIAGLGLMTAAVYSAFFVDWQTPVPPEPQLVRPLKTMVITSPFGAAGRKYPGKVSAHEEVQLAFQVSGQLIGFPVKNGLEVEKGELLGRLDRRDYENALAIRQAALEAAETDYRRMEDLWTRELAAKTEYANAKATYDAALAEVRIAQKALDDTDLHAPFAGVVADTYVDNFQNIDAAQPVLSLQDIEHVNIVVNVPEERVIRVVRGVDPPRDPEERAKLESSLYRLTATFEYLPGRAFDVEIKELTSKADSATQTYEATLVMPTPTDVTILPGMTATIHEYQREPDPTQPSAFAVPLSAVPIDDAGDYFVWLVEDAGDHTATVHRTRVQVGEMVGDSILVLSGVKPGDRVALAGVHLLEEGQRVRPFTAEEIEAP